MYYHLPNLVAILLLGTALPAFATPVANRDSGDLVLSADSSLANLKAQPGSALVERKARRSLEFKRTVTEEQPRRIAKKLNRARRMKLRLERKLADASTDVYDEIKYQSEVDDLAIEIEAYEAALLAQGYSRDASFDPEAIPEPEPASAPAEVPTTPEEVPDTSELTDDSELLEYPTNEDLPV